MHIVITGAGGQLGQDMATLCRKKGYTVTPFTSKQLDITDAGAVRSTITRLHPEAVINCAAYNAVDRAETDWRSAFRVNGFGVRNLALAARETDSVLVHYSTDYVFDGRTDRPYTIADLPNPLSRYGESKLLGEQVVRDLSSRFFLIRTSWVFGAGNTNFVEKVLEWSRDKTELKVVDDQVSSPAYTVHLARATLDLIATGTYGLYHLTNAGSCSRYEWARYILEATGWNGTILPAKTAEFPAPARRPAYSVLDNIGSPEVLGYDLPGWEEATCAYLKEVKAIP